MTDTGVVAFDCRLGPRDAVHDGWDCHGGTCCFITPLVSAGIEAVGVGADTAASIASVAAPAITGAAVGALGAGIAGGKPLTGALIGGGVGAVGGLTGAAGALSNFLGLDSAGTSLANSVGLPGSPDPSLPLPPIPPQLDSAGNPILDSAGNPVPSSGAGSSGASGASAAGGLASSSGPAGASNSRGLSATALGLAALAGLGQAFAKPQVSTLPTPGPSSVAANLGPTFNAPLPAPGSFPGRTPTNPQMSNADWYTYGSRPEVSFFNNNSLNAYGFPALHGAKGGALRRSTELGREFDTRMGDSWVTGRGRADGRGDEIDAKLSPGEYVLTAKDVSNIGRNDNEAGANKLDRLRRGGALSQVLARAVEGRAKKRLERKTTGGIE